MSQTRKQQLPTQLAFLSQQQRRQKHQIQTQSNPRQKLDKLSQFIRKIAPDHVDNIDSFTEYFLKRVPAGQSYLYSQLLSSLRGLETEELLKKIQVIENAGKGEDLDDFRCPGSGKIMITPLVDEEGVTYSEEYLRHKNSLRYVRRGTYPVNRLVKLLLKKKVNELYDSVLEEESLRRRQPR